MMAYNTNARHNTWYPRIFYTLYIGPNHNNIGHLIFKLSTKEISNIMKYQPVPVNENLLETISERDLFTNKIQLNHLISNRFTAQDDHFNNIEDDNETQSNDVNNSEDESHYELDSSQQIDYMESNTIVHKENQILLTMGLTLFTSVSVNIQRGITSTSIFLQGLFLQYL